MTSTLQTLAFKLAPPSREAGPEQLEPCSDGVGRRYEVVPSVVCSMCCLFGIIYCFFGELSLHVYVVYVCITKTQYLYMLPTYNVNNFITGNNLWMSHDLMLAVCPY